MAMEEEDIDKLLAETLARVHGEDTPEGAEQPRDSPKKGSKGHWLPTEEEAGKASPRHDPRFDKIKHIAPFEEGDDQLIGEIWPYPTDKVGRNLLVEINKIPLVVATKLTPLFPDHPEYEWGVLSIAIGHKNHPLYVHAAMHDMETKLSALIKAMMAGTMAKNYNTPESDFTQPKPEYHQKMVEIRDLYEKQSKYDKKHAPYNRAFEDMPAALRDALRKMGLLPPEEDDDE